MGQCESRDVQSPDVGASSGFCGCGTTGDERETDMDTSRDAVEAAIPMGMRVRQVVQNLPPGYAEELIFSLFKTIPVELERGAAVNKNVCISPVSIACSLHALYLASRGAARRDLDKALGGGTARLLKQIAELPKRKLNPDEKSLWRKFRLSNSLSAGTLVESLKKWRDASAFQLSPLSLAVADGRVAPASVKDRIEDQLAEALARTQFTKRGELFARQSLWIPGEPAPATARKIEQGAAADVGDTRTGTYFRGSGVESVGLLSRVLDALLESLSVKGASPRVTEGDLAKIVFRLLPVKGDRKSAGKMRIQSQTVERLLRYIHQKLCSNRPVNFSRRDNHFAQTKQVIGDPSFMVDVVFSEQARRLQAAMLHLSQQRAAVSGYSDGGSIGGASSIASGGPNPPASEDLVEVKSPRRMYAPGLLDTVDEKRASINSAEALMNIKNISRQYQTVLENADEFRGAPRRGDIMERVIKDYGSTKFPHRGDVIERVKKYASEIGPGDELRRQIGALMLLTRELEAMECDQTVVMSQCSNAAQMVPILFRALDITDQGTISRTELLAFLREVRRGLADNCADSWLRDVSEERLPGVFGAPLRGRSSLVLGVAHVAPFWRFAFEMKPPSEVNKSIEFRALPEWFYVSRHGRVKSRFMHLNWVRLGFRISKGIILVHIPTMRERKEGAPADDRKSPRNYGDRSSGVLIAVRRDRQDFSAPTLEEVLARPGAGSNGRPQYYDIEDLVRDMESKKRLPRVVTHLSLPVGKISFTGNLRGHLEAAGVRAPFRKGTDLWNAFRRPGSHIAGAPLTGVTHSASLTFAPDGAISGDAVSNHIRDYISMDKRRRFFPGGRDKARSGRRLIVDKPFLAIVHDGYRPTMMAQANYVSDSNAKIEPLKEHTWGSYSGLGGEEDISDEDDEYLEVNIKRNGSDGQVRLVQASDPAE